MCINWNAPLANHIQLYRQPLNKTWVLAGGCKQSLPSHPQGQSKAWYQECGCHSYKTKRILHTLLLLLIILKFYVHACVNNGSGCLDGMTRLVMHMTFVTKWEVWCSGGRTRLVKCMTFILDLNLVDCYSTWLLVHQCSEPGSSCWN